MNRTSLVRVIVLLSSVTFLAPLICAAQQRKKPKPCWDTANDSVGYESVCRKRLEGRRDKDGCFAEEAGGKFR